MGKTVCPVCGDPHPYKFWIDTEPPDRCPHDPVEWGDGPPTIGNVSECSYQRAKAWQAAEFRKLVPDAFDQVGKMKFGQLARVLRAFADAHPGKGLVIG